jgi:hypothetical protein
VEFEVDGIRFRLTDERNDHGEYFTVWQGERHVGVAKLQSGRIWDGYGKVGKVEWHCRDAAPTKVARRLAEKWLAEHLRIQADVAVAQAKSVLQQMADAMAGVNLDPTTGTITPPNPGELLERGSAMFAGKSNGIRTTMQCPKCNQPIEITVMLK